MVDAAVAATTESTGLTEGSHCGECGAVLVKQEVVPILENSENSITYHLYEDDAYLQKQEIENTNPNTYSSETGLTLKNISCEGYIFEGWYDGEGSNAKQVKQIATGETGNIDLYAHWTAREYTITFDSPLAKVDSIKYKVNEGATLTNPEWFGYTFMGWTDEKDNLVDKIPLGKTGNITLHANWTSKRNQTRPVKQLGEPMIVEDEKEGSICSLMKLVRWRMFHCIQLKILVIQVVSLYLKRSHQVERLQRRHLNQLLMRLQIQQRVQLRGLYRKIGIIV